MATISSVFKIQDNATKTFNTVANSIDSVIDKADYLNSMTSNMGAGVSSINPSLSQAIGKYNELISKQDHINDQIDMMSRQEKLIVRDLAKEKGARDLNEKAVFNLEKKLMDVQYKKEKLIQQSDKLTEEILNQASAVNQVSNNMNNTKPVQDRIEEGFSKWQAKIITINQTLQLMRSIAGGIQKVMNFSDSITLGSARLGMVNDGLQTTEELQKKIFAAAERSRGSYNDLAQSVSKLGLTAGDAFRNNDEMIAFSEMMNKSFKVSGASQQEISAATYQLTQAMAAGKLQGDEFRSISENAPMLAQAIADYVGVSRAELKELSREGKITADVIKAAVFSSAEEINAQYEQMPRTFADMTTSIKNTAIMEFQGVANTISDMLNNEKIIGLMEGIEKVIRIVANASEWLVDKIAKAAGWVADNLTYVLSVMAAVGLYMLVGMVPAILAVVKALFLKAAAWAAAHWQILAIIGVLTIAFAVFEQTGSILEALAWTILAVAAAYSIWNIAQWAINGALYACPIVWIIILILAVIAVIYLLIDWILTLTDSTNSALGIIMGALFTAAAFVYNLFAAVVNFVIDAFGILWNFIAAFVNFFANVFTDPVGAICRLFFDMVDTILGLLESLADVIDAVFGSDLAKSVKKWRKGLDATVEATWGEEDEIMAQWDADAYKLDRWAYGDAWDQGLEFGNKMNESIENFSMEDTLAGLMGGAEEAAAGYDYESLLDANGNVPVDVKNSQEVDISDEDLKMLKDIATREYMLNYKQITPNVNIEFGDVRETADVNKIKDALSKMMEEELAELYVVEEA